MPDWQAVQPFVIALMGAGMALLGWFGRTLYDRIGDLEKNLATHKVEVAKDYVSYIRFSETMNQVHGILGRIEGKLDGKQDK